MLYAQDSYRPLLKDGKTWELLGRAKNFEEVRLTQYVDGDTIVDGDHYYKMYTRMAVANTGEVITVSGPSLMQEEGGQVWELRNDTEGNKTRWLLYDFGLSVGDTFSSMGSDVVLLTVKDTIKVGDQLFRRYTFLPIDKNQTTPIYWVEGIGSLHGPMSSIASGLVGGSYNLTACYEDGACIFTGDDFSAPVYDPKEDDSYMPFVQEGKRWVFNNPDFGEYSYLISGDTVINQRSYKKVYLINGEGRTYQTAVREEDRVVYAQHLEWEREEIVYFFTTFGEEKYEYKEELNDTMYTVYRVANFYPIKASTGRIHQAFTCNIVWADGSRHMLGGTLCYEGIGDLVNSGFLFSPSGLFLSSSQDFVACYLDDELVATFDDLDNFVTDYQGITNSPPLRQSTSDTFDIFGRKLPDNQRSNPHKPKGIYIRDGRKVVVR